MAINLNWINVEAYSFNCVLLMERFPLRMLSPIAHLNIPTT